MDPNATLARIRAILAMNGYRDEIEALDVLGELADLVESLDKWLCGNGFLPIDWTR